MQAPENPKPPRSPRQSRASPDDYVELRTCSAFSFLEGASNPEELALRAAEAGHTSLALADRSGVYGLPRFHQAAVQAGLRSIVGARVDVSAERAGAQTDSLFPLLLLV